MLKLYFGNSAAIISTILLGVNTGYLLWGFLGRAAIGKWGLIILFFILLHGAFWYFANVRDLYSNSIVYATDGSLERGLFSVSSIQSVVFWAASAMIWVQGIMAFLKPQYRENIFYSIAIVSIIQMTFIECSRVWLYNSFPARFDYM